MPISTERPIFSKVALIANPPPAAFTCDKVHSCKHNGEKQKLRRRPGLRSIDFQLKSQQSQSGANNLGEQTYRKVTMRSATRSTAATSLVFLW
jgi:hypothetical protein